MASHLTPVSSSLFLPVLPSGKTPVAHPSSFRLVARACDEIWITKCTGDGARSSVTERRKLLMQALDDGDPPRDLVSSPSPADTT